ncbi:MAG: 4-hydroxythreonine-4-phosphate dehydrogenase PdxA [Candidatus Cloacimonetes bacterium]|nr:4-hydroxythreonine-4-phosphate dehydrogenase PdxA [Candidatus Cloacimonadota bacterium]
MKKIAITTGDPAGIGPELATAVLRFHPFRNECVYIVYGRVTAINNATWLPIPITSPEEAVESGKLYWIEIDDHDVKPGKPCRESGAVAISILKRCRNDLMQKKLDAVVTCPVSKHYIRISEPEFIGHTEFFAGEENSCQPLMTFWGKHFHLALLTTHVALSSLSKILTTEFVQSRLQQIYAEFNKLLSKSRFAMLAVNPHAGENGAFGSEDEMIKSVLLELSESGVFIDGPFPADTFFSRNAENYDVVISVYHDQGLIPFKLLHADNGVNCTLGLPFIRTSVDHGTAFNLAGSGKASPGSFIEALDLAEALLRLPPAETQAAYSAFASYYDRYMAHVTYDEWVAFILESYNHRQKKSPENVLELACGTCNVATRLVKRGIRVTAADIAPGMLAIGASKPFAPKIYRADMLDAIPSEEYDLILLLFDSINYLQKESQIAELLENVHAGLMKQGLFVFDISTLRNCRDNFDGFLNMEDTKDMYFTHTSELTPDEKFQHTHFTFFRKKFGLWDRQGEHHVQRVYKCEEIIDAIRQSPLKLLGIYSIGKTSNLIKFAPEELDKQYARLFFVTTQL